MPPFFHPIRRARRAITPKPIRRATRSVYRVRHPVRTSFWALFWGKSRKRHSRPAKQTTTTRTSGCGTKRGRTASQPPTNILLRRLSDAQARLDRAEYRLAHADEVAEAEKPIVTITEVAREGEVGTFSIDIAAPELSTIDPRFKTTQTDLDRREATMTEVWAEVARRTDGSAISPDQLRAIADQVMAERSTHLPPTA